MAGKTAQRSTTRRAKYQAHFAIAEANKRRNINKMKAANPNWPDPKKG